MKTIRKTLFWTHLICGATGGIVILTMCITGAMLAFEKNITEYAERDMRNVKRAEGAERMPVSVLLSKVLESRSNVRPSSIAIENDPSRAVLVSLGRESQVYVDPYTGNITGEGAKGLRTFFDSAESIHRYIGLSGDGRPIGKAMAAACNLMFLILAITGLYIWMPRRLTLKHVRPNVWFRRGLKGKGRDFNWHNTIGFWCSVFFIAVTVTGLVMSYQWANNVLYSITGNDPPQQQAPVSPNPLGQSESPFVVPSNIDDLIKTAEKQANGWKTISVRLPFTKDAVFTIDEGRSMNIFGRSMLTLDPTSGAVSKWEPYTSQNSGRQLRNWFRFIHTGESGGIVGQSIGFIVCIAGAFMVYTGLALAFRRFGHWKRRRS